ncbi:PTS sugar transporter subunit IIB [Candidatus Stoquefichus massiliensis]|uniref:PTS sugar transporter subunit IIB n=1 Tax=Candidatus Stoquefichus massiliensis TaxID=1470350 RepID=UPI0004885770|nr:PTS sugar transporter subunit IIB [Candidatus Stoquefichus massiliensis]
MVRILLVCAGGMSTSLLMLRMQEEAQKQNLDVSVEAGPEKNIEEYMGKFDVLLLGPQVRYALGNIRKVCEGKVPYDVIDMRDYGMMNGKKVLEKAIEMYKDFYHKDI